MGWVWTYVLYPVGLRGGRWDVSVPCVRAYRDRSVPRRLRQQRLLRCHRVSGDHRDHGHRHDHHDHHHQLHSHDCRSMTIPGWLRAITVARESLVVSLGSGAVLGCAFGVEVLVPSPYGRKYLVSTLLGAVLAVTGLPALYDSIQAVWSRRDINVDVLMTLAAGAAVATGAPFEGALLLVLYAVSHAAEAAVTAKARGDLDALRDLSPERTMRVLRDADTHSIDYSSAEEIVVGDIQIDDLVLVRAGEVVPCDGKVVDGESFVMMGHLTGESQLQNRTIGDEVLGGVRAVDGSLVVAVTRLSTESTVARIIKMVTDAQRNRPKVQSSFTDRFGRTYSRLILGITASIGLLLPILSQLLSRYGSAAWPRITFLGQRGSFIRALGFLVTASPCALLLSAPVAYLSALSICSRRGILVKGGARTLETLGKIGTIVFDKTGTLTTGELKVHSVRSFDIQSNVEVDEPHESFLLAIAAALEVKSTHPISQAILDAARRAPCGPVEVMHFRSIPGSGVEAKVTPALDHARSVVFGRLQWIRDFDFVGPSAVRWANLQEQEALDRGFSVSFLALEGHSLTVFRFQDVIRAEAKETMDKLRQARVNLKVLTGDLKETTQQIDLRLGPFDSIMAEVLPEDKLQLIESWKNPSTSESTSPGALVMVGDGINDAPALAAASVGVAMGFTSATSVFAADVVLIREDLRDIEWLRRKASASRVIVLQNIAFALALMLLSSMPAILGKVPLWLAVSLHEGSTILVGLNSLRLLSDKLS